MDFANRFRRAAAHARVEWSPTAIGSSLTRPKQTVARWMDTGKPSGEDLFLIAERWKVEARWLATGEGSMLPRVAAAELAADEQDLLDRYRGADARGKLSLRAIAQIATTDPAEYSADVNIHALPGAASPHELRRVGAVMERTGNYRTGRGEQTARRPIKKS